jgi:exopolysaccharide biosynthesis polyprenyl glycosylphosphotransferase
VWEIDWIGPIITGFGTVVLGASAMVYVPAGPLVPALHSYWLVIHVLGAMIAGSAFLVGAAASVLYLVKSRAERTTPEDERKGFLWRIPPSAKIDQVAYRVHAFAFPIWTFAALIAGPIWAQYAWGRYWGWDPKETVSFIAWVVYAAYLHARSTAGWRDKKAAWINVVGFVDDQPAERSEDVADLTILGDPEDLPAIAQRYEVDRVIVAFSNDSHTRTLELVRALRDLRVQIDIVPRLFEVLGPSANLHGVGGLPLVGLPPMRLSGPSRWLKRSVDLIASIAALVLLAPALALFALAIKLSSPGPAIFRQTRMGAGDKTFHMFKFRTMTVDADERKAQLAHLNKHARNGGDPRMFKIPDDPRVTSIGRFLRKYSLDELPQLVNVVLGDMTLVGPRPLILEEDREITEWGRRRLDLKPGMTGPWQVLGRNDIPFEEMVKIDYLYVTNWSLWRDLKLMAQTVPAIFRARTIVY